MTKKIYRCWVCGKIIDKENATRFIKQLYGYGNYKQFADIRRYDFCEKCYGTIERGIEKWKAKKQEGYLINSK